MTNLTAQELQQLDHRPAFVAHVTRHLARLSPAARDFVRTTCGISDEQVEKLLKTNGSKFSTKIDDPCRVIDFAKAKLTELVARQDIPWQLAYNGTKLVAKFNTIVTRADKLALGLTQDQPLGTSNIIEVTDKIRRLVQKVPRGSGEAVDQVKINIIKGLPVPTTDRMLFTLHKDSDTGLLTAFSVFSGTPTPSLPDPVTQSEAEFAESKAWWDRHAFLQ